MRRAWLPTMSITAATTFLTLAGGGCGGEWQSIADELLNKHGGGADAGPGTKPTGDGGVKTPPAPDEGPGCVYDNKTYALGDYFLSSDGCNQCKCDKLGTACTEKACAGGAGGVSGGADDGPSAGEPCEKVPYDSAAGCVPYADLKTDGTDVCAARGETLSNLVIESACDDVSARAAIFVCCRVTAPANDVACYPGKQASGVPCTQCIDAKGTVIKTDCN